MEKHLRVNMDSKPEVCYMNFGVDGCPSASSTIPEEQWLAI
jgi:hypothetical protein